MTAIEIYQTARNAGFPPNTAITMTAIALRESGGNPMAYNGTPPDDSFGLWQINMLGSLGTARLQQFGLSDPSQLFDPDTNARAAYQIWGGNDANLSAAWYIDRPVYKERYEQYLPAAQEAASVVDGGIDSVGGWTDPFGSIAGTWSGLDETEKLILQVVGAIAAGFVIVRFV